MYSWPLVAMNSRFTFGLAAASQWARDNHTASPEPRSAAQVNQPERGVVTIRVLAAPRSSRAIRLKAGRRPTCASTVSVAGPAPAAAATNGPASLGARMATGFWNPAFVALTFSAIASPVGPVVTRIAAVA